MLSLTLLVTSVPRHGQVCFVPPVSIAHSSKAADDPQCRSPPSPFCLSALSSQNYLYRHFRLPSMSLQNYLYRDSVTHIVCQNLPDAKIKIHAHER